MKPSSLFLAAILLSITWCCAPAMSRYTTIHNHFGSLTAGHTPTANSTCHIDDGRLVIDNGSDQPLLLCDSSRMMGNYQYQVRFASLHNKPGKRYSVRDSHQRKTSVANPKWGIVFHCQDADNYWHVDLSCENTRLYDDINDKRQLRVNVCRRINGQDSIVQSATVADGVDLYDGLNTLSVDIVDSKAVISLGKKKLQQVAVVDTEAPGTLSQIGVYAGSGAKVAIERAVISTDDNTPQRIATTWTRQALDEHFTTSVDPIEGYWQYQDRDIEEKWLQLGGRYMVAVVSAPGGYDIIYVSGAQVHPDQWQTGLLKGHLTKTIFDGHYDLTWIDATFQPISEDAYAMFDNGVLLTLNFPVYRSQMRLSKVLGTE